MDRHIFPHLKDIELKRLYEWSSKGINNKGIPWENILEPSDDPDPKRAKAINEARMVSSKRYERQGGPKISRGSNAKKPKIILPEKRVKAIRELKKRK